MTGNHSQNPNLPLFSEGDLTDFLLDRWQAFMIDVDNAPQSVWEDDTEFELLDLWFRHNLRVPVFLGTPRIKEHGVVHQPIDSEEVEPRSPLDFPSRIDYLLARKAYLEAQLHRSRFLRLYGIAHLPFEGDPVLFRYRPLGCKHQPPWGSVEGQSLRIRLEWDKSHGEAPANEFEANLNSIYDYLQRVSEHVFSLNRKMAETIEETAHHRRLEPF